MFRRPVSMSVLALGLALTVGLRAAAQAPARPPSRPPASRPPTRRRTTARGARRARAAAASGRWFPGTAAVPGASAAAGLAGGARARQGAVRRLVQRLPRRRRARRSARRAEPAPLAAGPQRQGRRADHPGREERPARAADAAAAGADADIKAMSRSLHDLQAQGTNQGGPPPGPESSSTSSSGDAKAGEAYFATQCATCHSATGDLQGIATRVPSPKALQNLWVSGGVTGGAAPGAAPRRSASEAGDGHGHAGVGEKVSGRLAAPRRLPRHDRPRGRDHAHHPARRRRPDDRGRRIRSRSIASCSASSPTRTCTT